MYNEKLRFKGGEGFEKFIFEVTELAKEINVDPIIKHSQGRISVMRIWMNQ